MSILAFFARVAGADGAISADANLGKVGGRLGFHLDDQLNGQWAEQIERYVEIPAGSINADSVEEMTQEASYLEGVAELSQAYSQQARRAAGAAARIHSTVSQHQQAMMGVNQRVMQTNAKYVKAQSKYQLGARIQRAEVSGYQAAYENANQSVYF